MYSVRTLVGHELRLRANAASEMTVRAVERAAWTTLEGTFLPEVGYIIVVIGLDERPAEVQKFAVIDAPWSDSVTATVRADVRVLCFSLRKGDVVDGVVRSCGGTEAEADAEVPGGACARLLRVSVGDGAATVYVSEEPDEGVQLVRLGAGTGGYGMRFERERAYDDDSHSEDEGGHFLGTEKDGSSESRLARPGAGVRIRITAVGPKWTPYAGQSFYGKLMRLVEPSVPPRRSQAQRHQQQIPQGNQRMPFWSAARGGGYT